MLRKKQTERRPRVGLSLGAGSARGFAHIGVLKVFEKEKIPIDYIVGCSAGSIIAAGFAAGKTAAEIETFAKETDWRRMIEFNLPWISLIKSRRFNSRINQFLDGINFKQLKIPFQTIGYNTTKQEKTIFSKGDVAKAVQASSAIPGIFPAVKIGKDQFIDGGVIDPNPIDILKEMGAEIIISVNLYKRVKTSRSKGAKRSSFLKDIKEQFVVQELFELQNYIQPKRWPRFLQKIFHWLFSKLLYPRRVLRIIQGRELPNVAKDVFAAQSALFFSLSREQSKHSLADIKIIPQFKETDWLSFDKIDIAIATGSKAAKKQIPEIKKKIKTFKQSKGRV